MSNAVCYVEFYTTNHTDTAKFFSDVFGWTTSPMMENYLSWTTGDSELGGGFSSEQVEQSGPRTIVYIHVDDIEATLAKVNANGGRTVLGKTKISDEYGYFAWFEDPCGATVGLWSKA